LQYRPALGGGKKWKKLKGMSPLDSERKKKGTGITRVGNRDENVEGNEWERCKV
jgi:hypothetical protein